MKVKTIINEIAFEKDCSLREARKIYESYKKTGKVKELEARLKAHKEV